MGNLLVDIINIAKQAGEEIVKVYQQSEPVDVQQKPDDTPLTEADLAAHTCIVDALQQLTPDIPILSEEDADIDFAIRSTWQTYWLVDPLDGTKEFLNRNGEFSVNIALIENNQSVLGVIYAPVLKCCYYAERGKGAFKQIPGKPAINIHHQPWQGDVVRVVVSRSHASKRLSKLCEQFENVQQIPMGSSLKSCMVAEGAADVYFRLGPTSEWDTAAAQCIVEEAGGSFKDVQGNDLRYNSKPSLLNPWFVVASDATVDWLKYVSTD